MNMDKLNLLETQAQISGREAEWDVLRLAIEEYRRSNAK